jgi:hypothetical protein
LWPINRQAWIGPSNGTFTRFIPKTPSFVLHFCDGTQGEETMGKALWDPNLGFVFSA